MKTRHPVEGSFGSEVPAIWNFVRDFSILEKNDPLLQTFQNSVTKVFIVTSTDVVVFKFHEIWPTGMGEIARNLPDKKQQNFACLSNCCYCMDGAQNPPGPAPNDVLKSAPDFIQIGSQLAEW